jgi:hypothetical protein
MPRETVGARDPLVARDVDGVVTIRTPRRRVVNVDARELAHAYFFFSAFSFSNA